MNSPRSSPKQVAKSEPFDVVIVGAGPAGLFAAVEIGRLAPEASVCVAEGGPALKAREVSERAGRRSGDWLTGFGGAGLFIGGRLSLDLDSLSGRPANVGPDRARELGTHAGELLDGWGAVNGVIDHPPPELERAAEKAARAGLTWRLNYPARHLPAVQRAICLESIQDELSAAGVDLRAGTRAMGIRREDGLWLVDVTTESHATVLAARLLLLAPGRAEVAWLAQQVRKNDGYADPQPSFGVRLEMPSPVLADLTDLTPDPRLFLDLDSGAFRTYAFVRGGSVAVSANDPPRITVRPAGDNPGPNSSFAILWQPSAGVCVDADARREPAACRLDQLRTETDEPSVVPADGLATAFPARPGDLFRHWPEAYWHGFDIFLSRLESFAPAIRRPETVLYSPSIERQWIYRIDSSGTTDVPSLYLAGDGAGVSQGAMAAALSGLAAGRGIAERLAKVKLKAEC